MNSTTGASPTCIDGNRTHIQEIGYWDRWFEDGRRNTVYDGNNALSDTVYTLAPAVSEQFRSLNNGL